MSKKVSNVEYTERDKKMQELAEFAKDQKRKSEFLEDVKALLKKYDYNKDYLNFAYNHIESERGLYTIAVPSYKDGVYDGDISILVSGTKEEVEKFKTHFEEKVKSTYTEDDGEITFQEDSYYYESKILGLNTYLAHNDENND